MQITLTTKEFDEAISLWLTSQGFSPDNYNITTRVIAGRSDYNNTRMEVTLDRIQPTPVFEAMSFPTIVDIPVAAKRFGQGHADE